MKSDRENEEEEEEEEEEELGASPYFDISAAIHDGQRNADASCLVSLW